MAQDHTFRVTHERTGKVVYEGESYMEAAMAQTTANVEERGEGREPFYRMWLVDVDGIGVIVKTQVG
jgi:hypothetical protein